MNQFQPGGVPPQQGQPQQGQPQQGQPQFSTPQYSPSETTQFMTRAGAEAKKRNISTQSKIWGSVWEARRSLLRFRLKYGENTRVVFLSNPIPVLAHPVYERWISKAGINPFAAVELARCNYYTFDQHGRWIQNPQGRPCLSCKVLGNDPNLYLVAVLLDLRPFRQGNGVVVDYTMRILETPSDTVRDTIYQSVDTWAPQFGRTNEPKFTVFKVQRSDTQMSPNVGDSWIFEQFANPNECQQFLPYLPNFENGWPFFSDEALKEILMNHIRICDSHNMGNKKTYSPDGAQEVFGGSFGGAQTPAPSAFGQPQGAFGKQPPGAGAPAQDGSLFSAPNQPQTGAQTPQVGLFQDPNVQNPQITSQAPSEGFGSLFGQPQVQTPQSGAGSPAPGPSGGPSPQGGQPQSGVPATMAGRPLQGQGSAFLAPQQGQVVPQQGQGAPGTLFRDPQATMPQGDQGAPSPGQKGPSLEDLDDIDSGKRVFNPYDQSHL